MLLMPSNSISVSQIFLSNYLKAWSNRDNIQNLTVKRSAASCSHLQGLGRKTCLMIASRLWLGLLSFIKLSLFEKWCLFLLHHDGTSNDPSFGSYPKKGQRETWKTKEMSRPLVPASAPNHNPHELFVVLAGEQALNKQEELKLAEQPEKYLELFMYEWLQGGKGRHLLFGQIR